MEKTCSQIARLLTDTVPSIRSFRSASGILHPGIGLTKEMLGRTRRQVRAQIEPWRTYFLDMLESDAASPTPAFALTDPASVTFSFQRVNGLFVRDALTAYTQAILYLVTGSDAYRRNSLTLIRRWSSLAPAEFAPFPDCHIHVGIPLCRITAAAELLRCVSFDRDDPALRWTEEDEKRFSDNLIRPALAVFLSDPNHFMNQHLYTVIGAMSAYLFLDDRAGYEKTVEWFTVNRAASNPGFNGSIRRLFRKITTADEPGKPEGSGRALGTPVVEHVEMGRDQAHGCGDLTNAAILARMMLAQGTKVDPVTGEASQKPDAVGIYEFDGERILMAADFFFRYMLGYSSNRDWVPVPFSIRDGVIADCYAAFSPNYRGRYRTINFWDLYVHYAYRRPDVNLAETAPYFLEGFRKKVPSVYPYRGKRVVNWDNVDGGGDFWLFLPEEAAGDPALLARPQSEGTVRLADRASACENCAVIRDESEKDGGLVRFSGERGCFALTEGGWDGQSIAFRYRSDGLTRLTVGGVKESVLLAPTGGQWKTAVVRRGEGEVFEDFYTVSAEQLTGTRTDLSAVLLTPSEGPRFLEGDETLVLCAGIPAVIRNPVEGASAIRFRSVGLPEGAELDESTGVIRWTPAEAGTLTFALAAESGEIVSVRLIRAMVCRDWAEMLDTARSLAPAVPCTSRSARAFREALERAEAALGSPSDEDFAERIAALCAAARRMEPLSPRLTDDPLTGGDSLDFVKITADSTMGDELFRLAEAEGTFCGYYKAIDRAHIMDFGEEFRLNATKFGFQARPGFSDRLAGVQVFGSADRENWIRLTEHEAAFTQEYQEIPVRKELTDLPVRYLMIRKTAEYPDALRGSVHGLLEFSVLRVFGERLETGEGGV
ncbi:MAG: hypothetical protein IKQ92_00225 [Clostridia bacterium]|nr:hypothetical protein [Clostridia bacterium]